jgi:hypothetical protein
MITKDSSMRGDVLVFWDGGNIIIILMHSRLCNISIRLMQPCYCSDATQQRFRPRNVVRAIAELHLNQLSATRPILERISYGLG